MDYRVGNIGRVVWARFDDGEDLAAGIIELAGREKIGRAMVLALGALGQAGLVTGPRETVIPPDPVWTQFTEGREILGIGNIAPGQDGPALHLHLAAGCSAEPVLIGCLRKESRVYLVTEVVMIEMTGIEVVREPEAALQVNILKFK